MDEWWEDIWVEGMDGLTDGIDHAIFIPCCLTSRCTHSAASFMPQSSEQYLEPGRVGCTQPGPRHCRSKPGSLASVCSGCFLLSMSFCFFSFCGRSVGRAGVGVGQCQPPNPGPLALHAAPDLCLHAPPHSTISVTFHSTFFFKFSIFFTFTAFFCSAGSRKGSSSVLLIQGCKPGKC